MSSRFPQLVFVAVVTLGFLFALCLVVEIGTGDFWLLAGLVAMAGMIGWIVAGREYWWLPMAFRLEIEGFFTIPFKLYPHEIALAAGGWPYCPSSFSIARRPERTVPTFRSYSMSSEPTFSPATSARSSFTGKRTLWETCPGLT